jgi:HPt (histidine-containing phosphotransfer) domain-containing protein
MLRRYLPAATSLLPRVMSTQVADEDLIFDEHCLQSLPGVHGDLNAPVVGKVIALFVSESTRQLTKIREACLNQDIETLHQQAHSLKSSAAAVGANLLARAARQLEDAARDLKLPISASLPLELENYRKDYLLSLTRAGILKKD